MDYVGNYRILKNKSNNLFVQDLSVNSKSTSDFVYSLRNFNTKTANLGESENFKPLVLLNAYSNSLHGLEKSKKQIIYCLILGVNLIMPTAGAIFSSTYLLANMWGLYKTQKALRNPQRGFFGRLTRNEISSALQ